MSGCRLAPPPVEQIHATPPGPREQLVKQGVGPTQEQAVVQTKEQPNPEIWQDVALRLRGFIDGRVYSAKRTPATPQSLNLQALNWLKSNENHLPEEWRHQFHQARLASQIVNAALPPGLSENELLATYVKDGQKIQNLNNALEAMADPRVDLRWVWGLGGAICAAGGLTTVVVANAVTKLTKAASPVKSNLIGGVLVGAGLLGVGTYAGMRAYDLWQRAREARWY